MLEVVLLNINFTNNSCRISRNDAAGFEFTAHNAAGTEDTVISDLGSFQDQTVAADEHVLSYVNRFAQDPVSADAPLLHVLSPDDSIDGMKVVVHDLAICPYQGIVAYGDLFPGIDSGTAHTHVVPYADTGALFCHYYHALIQSQQIRKEAAVDINIAAYCNLCAGKSAYNGEPFQLKVPAVFYMLCPKK